MIIVHHLENSRSLRILWLLEELGLDYDIRLYRRDPQTMAAPDSLKAIHPLGKAPIISDGELVIAESGAIIEYLLDRYDDGRLRPGSGQPLLDYRYWLHFAEGSLMPLLVMKLIFTRMPENPMPFFVRPVARGMSSKVQEIFLTPRLLPQLALINDTLAQRPWFTGEQLSGADIQMSFPLQAASSRADLSDYPHIGRFLSRVSEQPAYQRALARGGKLTPLG
ncbi:glutathione S-transferase [Pokkaliibacter plantistimulans]|uniref:Glutathione S-transferase n=1 Tax=Pokkaliibacter plantistimulans TaxID=1635171 RepID=A0ABX5LVK9_9GAMM|nr:glutathione S-transferase [Pokkaliibacter plantistimulans]PXF29645.1 glutathione S-transferase [Pokkaliibacter plantistimulans]